MSTARALLLTAVLTAGASSQTIIYPPSVRMAAPAGSTAPATGTTALSTSGTFGQNVTYDLSVQYGASAQGWLSLSPVHGTTPATIIITADPTNLAIGTYTAQILANVGPLHTGASALVTFIVAPTGSNPGGVAASPSSLTFRGASPTAQTLNVMTSPERTGTDGFTVFASPPEWLTVTASGQTTPAVLTVQPFPSGLTPGTRTGSIVITDASGKSTVVPVTLVLPDTGAIATAVLTPAQRSLLFNFQVNTNVNPQQTVFVSTNSSTYLSYTATASNSWIGVASAAFLNPASTTTTFAPGLLYVSVDPTGLAAGTYNGTVTLSATGLNSVNIPVTFTITTGTVFNANPSFVALDQTTSLLSSNLAVTGSNAFFFSATVSASWLSVTPSTAVASANPANLTVSANVANLPAGTFQGTITLTGSGGSPVMTIPVQLHTSAPVQQVQNALQFTPASADFASIAGVDMLPQFIVVGGLGTPQLPFTAAAVSDIGWLNIDRLAGTTPAQIKVTANSAAPAGKYSGSLVFNLLSTGDQTTLPMTLTLTARSLTAAPQSLSFVQASVGAPLASQQVQVTANAPSTFTIASAPAWISITPSTGLSTPATLTVSANPAGMTPGTYQDTIHLSGPNDVPIAVSLTVPAPAAPSVTPSSLNFTYQLGSPLPNPQTIQVASAGAATFTAAASTVSGANWLSVSPASGSIPGSVAVSVAAGQLVPGQQPGSVVITIQDIAGTKVTIPVTLTVTGSPVQVQSVLNAATVAPTSLAPGEVVTLTGFGLGPDTPVIAHPSAAGAYATLLGGSSVLFDGSPAPLLQVEGDQIVAIVPYAVYGRSTSAVQVMSGSNYSVPIQMMVADAAPGIFTSTSSGRFQAGAFNADFTTNSAINPAQRGSVIVLYLTGEGATDPPGQDGRVITADLRKPLLPVTATIGGQAAQVLYAGSAPNMVSGICQVNLLIPTNIDAGTQPVQVQIGSAASQPGVTIQVR